MRHPVIVLLVCLSITKFSIAQAQERDGRTWGLFSENEKLIYVAGFFDGNEHATRFLIETAVKSATGPRSGRSIPEKIESAKGTIVMSKAIDEGLLNVAPSQLVDGMNKTYGDYRNLRVRLPDVASAVLKSIKGASESEISRFLEGKRKEATR